MPMEQKNDVYYGKSLGDLKLASEWSKFLGLWSWMDFVIKKNYKLLFWYVQKFFSEFTLLSAREK